jgi:hypothetical protein
MADRFAADRTTAALPTEGKAKPRAVVRNQFERIASARRIQRTANCDS